MPCWIFTKTSLVHLMKRFCDIVGSAAALFFLSPILIGVGFLVRLNLGSPVVFHQLRPGLNGKTFNMFKFRSMANSTDKYGRLMPDSERISPFGGFLRATSFDELLEFWNVLKGEMSLVGPRPLLIEYLPLYSPEQSRRHNVRPGITGWAQVNGRNAISWEEKFEYDVWYVENQSCFLDMKIIWMTIIKVVAREGISADGKTTMPKFTGTKEQ